MEIVTKVMEKSWKSHGNLLVKMCTNPEQDVSTWYKHREQYPRAQNHSWKVAFLHRKRTEQNEWMNDAFI